LAAAAAKVSTGVNDKGGVSYGAYQLASSAEGGQQVQAFLQAEGKRWAPDLAGLDPTQRGGAFQKTWQAIAARDPDAFFQAQHDYIRRTHYDRVIDSVRRRTGVDLDQQSDAVRNVVWSMAVQHGGARRLVSQAVGDVGARLSPSDPRYGAALINRLYDRREAYVRGLDRPDLVDRYRSERTDALQMLAR
jgi:type VI secretion system secreted protein VgrG